MSHFVVGVITQKCQSIEELLEPFCESTENPEYLTFQIADEREEDFLKDYELNKNENETLEKFMNRYYGYIKDSKTGKYGYMHNPNARWDWYEIGGRWDEMLKLKNSNEYVNSAKIEDIDFSQNKKDYENAIRYWEVVVEKSPLRDGEKNESFNSFYKSEYYIDQYGSKENYAKAMSEYSIWACITPDGKWHEQGNMGWFGFSNSTMESRMNFRKEFKEIIQKYNNYNLTIVDCHI